MQLRSGFAACGLVTAVSFSLAWSAVLATSVPVIHRRQLTENIEGAFSAEGSM